MRMPGLTAEASLDIKRHYTSIGKETSNSGPLEDKIEPAGCLENEYDVCRSQGGGRFECAVGAIEECGRRYFR